MTNFSWPKPSIFPWCSVTYALINAGITYGLAVLLGSQYQPNWADAMIWSSLSWVMNAFFVWAEYVDYRREKNNYEGWNAEMKYLSGDDLPKSWQQRVNQLRRPRN